MTRCTVTIWPAGDGPGHQCERDDSPHRGPHVALLDDPDRAIVWGSPQQIADGMARVDDAPTSAEVVAHVRAGGIVEIPTLAGGWARSDSLAELIRRGVVWWADPATRQTEIRLRPLLAADGMPAPFPEAADPDAGGLDGAAEREERTLDLARRLAARNDEEARLRHFAAHHLEELVAMLTRGTVTIADDVGTHPGLRTIAARLKEGPTP